MQTATNQKIRTVRDARLSNLAAKESRMVAIERRELTKKVARWEKKVALYGGDVHKQTLAKFQAQLASVQS